MNTRSLFYIHASSLRHYSPVPNSIDPAASFQLDPFPTAPTHSPPLNLDRNLPITPWQESNKPPKRKKEKKRTRMVVSLARDKKNPPRSLDRPVLPLLAHIPSSAFAACQRSYQLVLSLVFSLGVLIVMRKTHVLVAVNPIGALIIPNHTSIVPIRLEK